MQRSWAAGTTLRTIANAIEAGDIKTLIETVTDYPESYVLVERVVTVSAKYR